MLGFYENFSPSFLPLSIFIIGLLQVAQNSKEVNVLLSECASCRHSDSGVIIFLQTSHLVILIVEKC